MKPATRASLLFTAFAASVLVAADAPWIDPHVLKEGRPHRAVISDPYEWTLIQLADGPVTGPGISDYARLVIERGLCTAHADLDGDGQPELFLGGDSHTRTWQALIFKRVAGGFRYLGSFGAAHRTVVHSRRRAITVFEPAGGHCGYIREYELGTDGLVLTSSEGLRAGDGAPARDNERIEQLFRSEDVLHWNKMDRPDSPSGAPRT